MILSMVEQILKSPITFSNEKKKLERIKSAKARLKMIETSKKARSLNKENRFNIKMKNKFEEELINEIKMLEKMK